MAVKASRTDTESVVVHLSKGEKLVHQVKFLGNQASFVINDDGSGEHLLSSADPTVPGTVDTWKREWPTAADPTSKVTDHVTVFTYVSGATQYTYTVTLQTAGSAVTTLVDIDYAGPATDNDFHTLHIFVV